MSAYCLNCMEPLVEGQSCAFCGDSQQRYPSIAHHLPAGTFLSSGRYLVGRAIGQGGFGITYIGRDLTLDLRIAIKEYFPTLYVSRNSENSHSVVALGSKAQERLEAGRRRFLDEARVLAKFHGSPGIVDVRDFFTENNTAYIVMDFLDGETLKDHLKRELIGADRVFELMGPVLDTLERIHAEQVVHRDISPDNIMLCNDGKLRLMDFGAAHELDYGDQRTVSMVLKAGYAPEEQYRARGELGPWTDIYSLCATMYRAITGLAPDESLQRLISDEMVWPSDMGIPISPIQEALLKKGMAPKSNDRFQTIAEMKEMLDAGSAGQASLPGAAQALVHQREAADERTLAVGDQLETAAIATELDLPAELGISGAGRNPQKRKGVMKDRLTAIGALAVLGALALVLYFMFYPVYAVSFDVGNGVAYETVKASRMDAVDAPAAPTRKGYTFNGWYLDDALSVKAEFPLEIDADTTLYAAWGKAEASYRITYVDVDGGDEIDKSKVVENAKIGSTISVKAKSIDGYVIEGDKKADLVISEDDASNVVTFSYRKLVDYTVNYLEKGTDEEVLPKKTVEGNAAGTKVVESAPEVAGYTLQSESEQAIILGRDSDDNKITFYYDPIPVMTSVPTAYYVEDSWGGGSSGGRSAGGGTSGGGSGSSSSSSNDVEWAN